MRKFANKYIIGIDHGFGNIKTANCCFPTGVMVSDTEPTFKQDTPEAIHNRLLANHSKPELYVIVYPQRKRAPLLAIEYAYREAQRMDGPQLMFAVFIELLKLCAGNSVEEKQKRPLSPLLREEVRKLDQYIEDYKLLCDCHIDTAEELSAFRADITGQIAALNADRDRIRNRIRRAPEEEKADLKAQAKAITQKIEPLRKQQRIAKRIAERTPQIETLLAMERQQETEFVKGDKNNERNKSRTYTR